MKALLCKSHGEPDSLVFEDCESPHPLDDEVVVTVHAAGVNLPDVLKVQGRHQLKPPLPFSPGHEVAGVIKEVGKGVKGFAPGDRVVSNLRYGGFREEVAVKADHSLARFPDTVDFVMAAALPLAYGTSFHALRRGSLVDGETLLVLGAAGGVGLAAVQIGKLLGATVIACASSDERLATCTRFGADHVVNYEKENLRDAVRDLTSDRGVDVVVDPVGGRHSEPALRSLAWNGRHVVIGFAGGSIPSIPLNLILLKGGAVLGAAVGTNAVHDATEYRENLRTMIDWMAQGRLTPAVSRTYPFAQAREAIGDLLHRRIEGKAVITMR